MSVKQSMDTVYLLELESDGSLSKSKQFIRLPPPTKSYILRFFIRSDSLISNEGVLYTNHPLDGSEFDRNKFHSKKFPFVFSRPLGVDITIKIPGAFEFYIEYKENETVKTSKKCYFTVDPIIEIVPRYRILSSEPISNEPRVPIPLDGIVIQSVLPKLLGPISQWDDHIKTISDLGYNMIHFVPMQSRGASNSPYSIFDQLTFSDDLFDEKDCKKSSSEKIEIIKKTVNKLDEEYGILSLTDIVLNHTAHNSEWLQDHPEAGYNLVNSPHLTPAYELDTALLDYSENLSSLGYKSHVESEEDLKAIMEGVKQHVISKIRLWEFYVIDVKEALSEFHAALDKDVSVNKSLFENIDIAALSFTEQAKLLAEKGLYHNCSFGQRFYKKINIEIARAFIERLIETEEKYKNTINDSNVSIKDSSQNEHLNTDKLENSSIPSKSTLFKQSNGMNKSEDASVDCESQEMTSEKTIKGESTEVNEIKSEGEKLHEIMLKKFEAIVNEINLPLYKSYDDEVATILENLWNRAKYLKLDPHGPKQTEISRRVPLVEQYFTRIPLNEKTKKHPKGSLAVVNNGWIWNANPMQDFASSESFAYLRREVIVWGDCVKLRYGKNRDDSPWLWDHMTKYAVQLASFFHGFRIDNCHSTPLHVGQYILDAARHVRPNLYVVAELFTGSEEMDIKFVNHLGINSLIREAMQAWDPHELSRLVHRHGGKPIGSIDTECLTDSSTCTNIDDSSKTSGSVVPLTGSNPHALFMDCTHDNETPHQKKIAEDSLPNGALVAMSSCAIGSVKGYDEIYPTTVDLVNETRPYKLYEKPLETGIGRVKKVLQHLHVEMTLDGYTETHVHHENDSIIVHRVNPHNHNGYLLIAHCAFSGPPNSSCNLSPVKLRGTKAEVLFSTYLEVQSDEFVRDEKYLTGLPVTLKPLNAPNLRETSDERGKYTEVTLPKEFPSGSVTLLKTEVNKHNSLDEILISDIDEAFQELNLVDLNIVLYRCGSEENDVTPGHGTYEVPGYGHLPYCGLEGFMSVLRPIMKENDLGHPFCNNLREGHWVLDYVVDRLVRYLKYSPNLKKLCDWFQERFTLVKTVPGFLIPKYFSLVVKTAYSAAIKRVMSQLSPCAYEGSLFIQSLALCSVQMYGIVLSTGLHPTEIGPSMAAGLPHFATSHMRCWGRDVFISLRGLFLTTGNFEAAKKHIIGFGSVLKHGMIPNLLDAARRPRYNCRDAPWWFLQSIQDYCKFSPEGLDFLKTPVTRRFHKNDEFIEADDPQSYKYEVTILEIIQEIMERHANGIHFKEWNAGPNLDHAMTDKGFHVDVDVDWETGFLNGGNEWNCGTWMDKMGESEKAGNKGKPATPRNGAAVEIIGLLKSTLRWITELNKNGHYPWKGIELKECPTKKFITFAEWDDLIQKSFEKNFYIPIDQNEDSKYKLNPKLVSRRGIYKDLCNSSREYEDYQLRPNFPVAMVVAPELFDEHHALQALNIAREILAGPLGMRTLDPNDWAYRGVYDNSNDGTDPSIAKGWNYHQGPEWLWCTGYFLRAYLYFDTRVGRGKENKHETIHNITRHLKPHRESIETNAWAGLPELTNADGAPCHHSCPTQAWSAATILDLFDDIKKLEAC
ncbi:glycoside hydrolase family 13 protein [Gigaspora rosea]|uniref:Glycogen debranching enzyme n=1 Tax=Gigaspora rosea TaxID=44941 RepID=A0A397TVQ0_9GLOM|nr:glycoside hydrolase family 13 protein [Gigaspora rosea]